jgi:Flp pilus assembly protein TadG
MRGNWLRRPGGERGSVITFVAVGILALTAFSVLVLDFGVMWLARRQAQTAADAGALAAATCRAFDMSCTQSAAQEAAVAAAQRNAVFGQPPTITTADVTFPSCPPGAPGVADTCVRVNVFRNQARGSALPVVFGQIVGISDQGVTATATAQMLVGGQAKCLKPWAVPDIWFERKAPADTYDHYDKFGNLLTDPDIYCPPNTVTPTAQECLSPWTTPTGYQPPDALGTQLVLKVGSPHDTVTPGWFFPVVITPGCPGGDCYREAIAGCVTTPVGPGTVTPLVDSEPGNMIGPTKQGVKTLVDADPDAEWDCADGTQPTGSCASTGTCPGPQGATLSPRLAAVPLFDPERFEAGKMSGRTDIFIVGVIGIWIHGMRGNDVEGCITYPPTLSTGGASQDPSSTFLRTVILVR